MKVKIVFLLMCMFYNITSAQLTETVYRVFERPNEDCRDGVEDIILYNNGVFYVRTSIGGIAVRYQGGWWIKDSMLVLQPSLNCDSPKILRKKEFRDRKCNAVEIEIYNENGRLIYYGIISENNQIENIWSEGCVISGIKEGIFFKYFNFVFKGKSLASVKTKKKNNKIEIIILEPSTNCDLYLGKMEIPISSLVEISIE